MKTNNFDTSINAENYLMTAAGCNVGVNTPEALKSYGAGPDEVVQGLPPFRPRAAFLVDEYPACPEHWMRSTGRIKSYFVPVIEDHGMWLDFRETLRDVPNDVAIVVSAQGVNALTYLPCKDAALEQYIDECPKHKKPFGPDRLCRECGFQWPKQNYIASTGTPHTSLWLDGFRCPDGKVRQYVFTDKKERGVANAIIGKDRVFAIGVSFFLSRAQRPKPAPAVSRGWQSIGALMPDMDDGIVWDKCVHDSPPSFGKPILSYHASSPDYTCSTTPPDTSSKSIADQLSAKGGIVREYKSSLRSRISHQSMSMKRSADADAAFTASVGQRRVAVKNLELAAGARISQRIYDDPNPLDYWNNEPAGIVVINYCTEAEAEAIIAAGKVDVKGSPEGALQGIPVGNP